MFLIEYMYIHNMDCNIYINVYYIFILEWNHEYRIQKLLKLGFSFKNECLVFTVR